MFCAPSYPFLNQEMPFFFFFVGGQSGGLLSKNSDLQTLLMLLMCVESEQIIWCRHGAAEGDHTWERYGNEG